MRLVLPSGRGRRIPTLGAAAVTAAALAVVIGAPTARAATRHAWVAAVPMTWNAVPNARDAIHGATFDRAETTFPTVVYARYTRNWGKPVAGRASPARSSRRGSATSCGSTSRTWTR